MKYPEKHFLETSERNLLKDLHRRERDKRVCDRIKAILCLDNGWSYKEIAEALLLDEDTIRRYDKTYTAGGVEALSSLQYSGRLPRLKQHQLDDFKVYVKEKVPSAATEVVEYIRKNSILYTQNLG